jgi:hypothetical protein
MQAALFYWLQLAPICPAKGIALCNMSFAV